jgi:hypothetical protein
MRRLTSEDLNGLLTDPQPPCVSLYQPTHRRFPENQQDRIRYRNLLKSLEASLREKYPRREVRPLVERFEELARADDFWNHRTEGLVILSTPERFQLFDLQRPVKELLVVADSFHVKPILRNLQAADRFQILCLSRQEAKLYEGNRDSLDPVDLTGIPATITEALGSELTEPHQVVRSLSSQISVHHGGGQKKDEVDNDIVRFFRIIDRAILERHSRPSGLPLMLAALAEYHAPFREVSHNPYLMAEGLAINPDALSLEELRIMAWEKIEPLYQKRLASLIDAFRTAQARQQGSDDLVEVVRATLAGRTGVLLIEADRQIPGRIDAATGQIEPGDLSHPGIDDVLDDLAETALRMKSEVVVVPGKLMPTTSGVAATYRY